jgi:hypothetical protein
MSGPYVFTPSAPSYQDLASPYLYQYNNRQRISPHIPTIGLTDPSAPNTPIRGSKVLDDDPWTPPRRARRPSWHAGMSTPFLPGATIPPTPMKGTFIPDPSSLTVPADYTHTRRRSLDSRYQRPNVVDYYQNQQANPYPWMVPGAPIPPVSGPSYAYSQYPPFIPSEIHPLLRPDSNAIFFDLSLFEFRPVDARGHPIPVQTLAEPATHPPTTRLVVTNDKIPEWPVLLDYHAATHGTSHSPSSLPPITLGDVLYAIHQTFQTQITHREWAELDDKDEAVVARAYMRRYKLVPGHESRLAAEGVKRVDYLLKRVMFGGLTRKSGDQGYENLKLHAKTR